MDSAPRPPQQPHKPGWYERCELTPDAVDSEGVQLLLPVLALARQVGHGLHLSVEQVVQQCQRHLLGCAAVRADVQHVGGDDGTTYPHLRVILIAQPRAIGIVL